MSVDYLFFRPHQLLRDFSQSLDAWTFKRSGAFRDCLGHYSTAAYLSGCFRPTSHDYWPQFFAIRLKIKSLHFFSTHSQENHIDLNLLVDAFRQNCTTFVKVLKARIKAAKQQTGLDTATFFCDSCMLGRRTYRNQTHLLEQIFANSLIEGPKYNTFWQELRKLKHATADNAFIKALDFQTYRELQGPNAAGNANGSSTDVNQLTKQFLQDNSVIFEEVVRSLKRDIDKLLQSRDRGLRRKSCGQEPYTNDSMVRRKRIDLHKRIESSYGNGTRDDGKLMYLHAIDAKTARTPETDMDKATTP